MYSAAINRLSSLTKTLSFHTLSSFRYSSSVSAMASTHIKKQYDGINKSQEDNRFYRGLELNNGMKVLLISDPTTDKSSAALDVNIGHMSDPMDIPGLAHFCEHMLFLGTEKYPEENQYNKFLSEHAGSSNAFTSGEHTNYYFDVTPAFLEGALDRFAQFFLCPLFTASATEREVNAVDSENDKNLQSDSWRVHQLEKSLCKAGHDYTKFGTGNKDTLLNLPKERGQDVRDELLAFHDKFYSANIMGLAVLGKESLDELTEMVVPVFSGVKNKDVKVPEWQDHPVGPEQCKLDCRIIPVKDVRQLMMSWPIMDLHPYYKSNPGHYLGHLIGHEGPGSLLSELKSRGWGNNLVGGQKSGANGFMFFIVNVDLSEEGIEHIDDIVTLTFQYFNMLKKVGPQKWVFQECQDLNAMGFRFKDKERPRNYTCTTSSLLHDYPVEEVLSGVYLMEEYQPEIINMILDRLTTDDIRLAVIGQKYQDTADQKEKWYGTEYKLDTITAQRLKTWQEAGFHDNLRLPDLNEFIPTNFDLVTRDPEPQSAPALIRDTDMTRLWYRQDDKFLMPKACINVEFTSPYAYMDPLSTSLSYMFVALFKDALNEYAYAAEISGLMYDLHTTIYGLTLSLQGYNDKQHILLQKILEKMTTFKIDTQRFNILKENYERSLKNFKAEQPHQHAVYYTTTLVSEQVWTKDELLDSLEEVTIDRLEPFIPQLLSRMHTEMLVYGNVNKEGANSLADLIENTLTKNCKTKPLLSSQQRRFREVQMPDGCYYLYKRTNEVHKSSSLEVYYQCSVQNTQTNMLLELYSQIISEPCFDILRTQEQLGYIVFSGVRRSNGVQGLRVIVQSDRSPEYVESRVEAFMHKMESYINDLEPDTFKNHLEALATRRLEKPKKLSSQNSHYWSEIISQHYNFDRDNIEVAHLKTLTKEDVLKFYKELLAHDAPKRHKLSVHVISAVSVTPSADDANDKTTSPPLVQVDGETPTPPMAQPREVMDVCLFKKCLPLFPLPEPFINFNNTGAKSKL